MSRGMITLIAIIAMLAVLGMWAAPAVKRMLGLQTSFLVKCNILNAVDDPAVPFGKDDTVPRTIVDMEIIFPMGGAPENLQELEVRSDDGQSVAEFPPAYESESGDQPEKGVTRWVLKDVYFPMGFRQGKLRNKYRELCNIMLTDVTPAGK